MKIFSRNLDSFLGLFLILFGVYTVLINNDLVVGYLQMICGVIMINSSNRRASHDLIISHLDLLQARLELMENHVGSMSSVIKGFIAAYDIEEKTENNQKKGN
jgi:hypothetical protein